MNVLGFFSKCLRLFSFTRNNKSVRLCSMYDKNFYYFRNKNEYKNLVVLLNDDSECKVAGPGFSFLLKEQNADTDGFFYHLTQRENVMKLSTAQLKDIMCLIANGNFDTVKYTNALKYLDEKCALSVERWPLDLSLYIMDAWFIILGPRAFRKHYYSAITSFWSRRMKKCSKYNLLLILYFVGMSKTAPPFLMELLEYKLESLASGLTDEEHALACLSFFKTSTQIKSNMVLKHSCNAAKNLLCKDDRFNLISILKCLRLSKYLDDSLMHVLDKYIKQECKTFNFVECTNFLASFATQNMYNLDLYNCLESQGISCLSQEIDINLEDKNVEKIHPSEKSRIKDLARFLWSMAFVGHDVKNDSIEFLVNYINDKLRLGNFEKNIACLIDCFQSLILLGQYPQILIEYVTKSSFSHKMSKLDKAKPKYQAYFIYRSAYIEQYITEPKLFKHFNHIPKVIENDIVERRGFQHILNYLSKNIEENSFRSCYVMPHIMISGIFVATTYKSHKNDSCQVENSVTRNLLKLIETGVISRHIKDILNETKFYTCIEILDPSVCVKGNFLPLGLMKTKLRQLKRLNINVITFTPEEISALTHSPEQTCIKLASLFT